ncbi:arylamine N-acetyltransferase family protein [Desulfosporosinus sp. SYSU MS00001]|uniref:arylamine N-acetyltransferase family protein n=1 Tax=Desulfosporosinus sp. SYSU MS00001 TaxID=3416284 RepID=UPI003CFA114E
MTKDLYNIDAYLERIKYEGKVDVSYETLYALHTSHTLNVPFENLDVYNRTPILLDPGSLYEKIVKNKRGGYCFEMNGLFSFILKELGFKVTDLLARGTTDGKTYFAKLHQMMMVEIDNKRWLVDVGYGKNGITAPLLLQEGVDQRQFTHTYRLLKDPKFGFVLQYKVEDRYQYLYAFTLDECYPMDFQMSNHFTATYPDSLFLKMKFCTMPTKEGRITLTDDHFKVIANGKVFERHIENDSEFNELLNKHFKLNLNLIK